MHLRRKTLTLNKVCYLLHLRAVHLVSQNEVCDVCDSEMSEMNVRLYRCTMWKAHSRHGNGTVDHLNLSTSCHICLTTIVLWTQTGIRATVNAQRTKALKDVRAVWCFIDTSRSDTRSTSRFPNRSNLDTTS